MLANSKKSLRVFPSISNTFKPSVFPVVLLSTPNPWHLAMPKVLHWQFLSGRMSNSDPKVKFFNEQMARIENPLDLGTAADLSAFHLWCSSSSIGTASSKNSIWKSSSQNITRFCFDDSQSVKVVQKIVTCCLLHVQLIEPLRLAGRIRLVCLMPWLTVKYRGLALCAPAHPPGTYSKLFDKPIRAGVYMILHALLVIWLRSWCCLYAWATLCLFHVGNLPWLRTWTLDGELWPIMAHRYLNIR